MIHHLMPTMDALLRTDHAMKVGDWEEVLCEYAPGTCSEEKASFRRDDPCVQRR
jgi:hypothetical protein